MTSKHSIALALIHHQWRKEAINMVIMVLRDTEGSVKGMRAVQPVARASGPTLRQPTFHIEVVNIFPSKSYNMEKDDKVPVIMNWLGYGGLRFVQH